MRIHEAWSVCAVSARPREVGAGSVSGGQMHETSVLLLHARSAGVSKDRASRMLSAHVVPNPLGLRALFVRTFNAMALHRCLKRV